MGRGGGVGWFFTDGAQYGVRGWVGWDLIVEAHGGGVRGANGDFRAFGSRCSGAGWVEAPKFVGGLFGTLEESPPFLCEDDAVTRKDGCFFWIGADGLGH